MYIQQPVADYVKSTAEVAIQIHQSENDDGDILCFLPTGEDSHEAVEMAENLLSRHDYDENESTIHHLRNNNSKFHLSHPLQHATTPSPIPTFFAPLFTRNTK
jgi:HrpA-like RNA helicase